MDGSEETPTSLPDLTVARIPHYYGDIVRQLFLVTAAVIGVSIPLIGGLIRIGVGYELLAAITLVLLAGLTNPRSRAIMICNSAVSVIGIMLVQLSAYSYLTTPNLTLLLAREAVVFLLIFALYYSVKTLRAMMLGYLHLGEE